jgi:hypothetical protein
MRGANNIGSRGGGEFKLPNVSNKIAMGGMKGLPGMPGSKGMGMPNSRGGGGPPKPVQSYMNSGSGAGYNKPGA